jgi:peptide/nickel transport system ATP-binding protein
MLAIESLAIAIGETPLIHPLSLKLAEGKTLALVGESGSGKSLTALAILGLLPARARSCGRILFRGEDLLAMNEKQSCAIRGKEIGFIFQEPMSALNPMQGIGDQLIEAIRQHNPIPAGEARQRARELLARVGLSVLTSQLERRPHSLSGGQRQRVAIAIAIANKPSLLIADEPTTALDASTQAQILELLRSLSREQGCALLLISHDLAVVAEYADEVAVMQSGSLLETGPTERVFAAPAHPYTRALIASSRLAPRPLRAVSDAGVPLLEIEDLVRKYRRPARRLFERTRHHRAVDSVSLRIQPGEAVGLVGESGCGKSTLLRTLLGLEAVQGGAIRLAGERFSGEDTARQRTLRRQIQIVFQDPRGSFDPRWSVEQIIAEPFHLLSPLPDRAERKRRVEEALCEVGLSPADAQRRPHEFSGGQRQRIAIARALVTRPRLLILDEAVSALDVTIRGQILELLATLSERLGIAYLFASHDLAVVRAVTDRVYVMRKGRIIESGPTARVFSQPRHPYTAALLAASPSSVLAGTDGNYAVAWAA